MSKILKKTKMSKKYQFFNIMITFTGALNYLLYCNINTIL